MDNNNQQPQDESPWQPQDNTQWQHPGNTQWQHQGNTQWQAQANTHGQPQVDSQDLPPSYSESVKNSSQTGYGNYPQSYPQNPAAYPTQQGYAATAGCDPSKAAYPTQGYGPGGGYTNYGHQPYYPPPSASNNNQTVIITQNTQDVVTVAVRNYICLAIFAIFMFLPTGIVAFLKANEAQNQYRMGNIDSAHAYNMVARKFIRISLIIGLVLIILLIVLRVMQVKYYSTSYG